jgi:hypothetical protein
LALVSFFQKNAYYSITIQDEVSLAIFGPMSREFGGTKRRIVHLLEQWSFIKMMVKSHYPIGNRNSRGRVSLLAQDGSWKKFDVMFLANAEAKCSAMVGVMVFE